MQAGHALRDQGARSWPEPSGELDCDVAILGSGVAGVTAAWKLAREGHRNFVLLSGPEPGGNTAGGGQGDLRHPTGAHYLPLPSRESVHVREILHALGILQGDPQAARPHYDEMSLVHPLQERLFDGGRWHDELLPAEGMDAAERTRFQQAVAGLRGRKGRDGRLLFAMPAASSSQDSEWRALDALSFREWLQREGYRDARLHWYADYCCRDDYGAGSQHVSAWAGLHYFVSRTGEAANADTGSLLTWPDGLHTPVQAMLGQIAFADEAGGPRRLAGSAVQVRQRSGRGEVIALQEGGRSLRIRARRVIVAMPLFVAARVVEGMQDFGFDVRRDLLPHSSWLVANFQLRRFPREPLPRSEHEYVPPLAWDNVLREGRGLGYVVATHQLIRVARPEHTVFTAYKALPFDATHATRRRLASARPDELLDEVSEDLLLAYGDALWPLVERVAITVRAHAISIPVPGFLSNAGLAALRELDGHIRFAHSDLSGYSVFEEAAWWGWRAALDVLGKRS
ncbi:NAD(P)-binding protein [Uliginosibacterium sp. H1]|uniref:NAD(P)-binding protein n=1 Tax=Uliginosibacterium sp. H1 TaxID=3114757 RepID=UPI002E189A64|nr:NAD(P)-binding protein [Uliginosibacterium sp. H1]